MLPSFDDFLADMGETGRNRWFKAVNDAQIDLVAPTTPDTLQSFTNSILKAAVLLNVEMMRDYHSWLEKELAKKSVRLI